MRQILILVIASFLVVYCSNSDKQLGEIKTMNQSIEHDLQTLKNAKIFFGHQSVGYNILEGVSDIIKESGVDGINLVDFKNQKDLPKYYFAHSKIGQNTKPNTKCDDFTSFLTKDFASQLDIAFLKFCYIDMRSNDNPEMVFDYYKSTIDSLKSKFPNIKFVHSTLPLTTLQSGWKAVIKKVLGKEISGYKENINRSIYNELLKDYYGIDPIFDISKLESTYPDGSRESFEFDGQTFYALVPDYTSDGGHLNKLGRDWVAKGLINTLGKINK